MIEDNRLAGMDQLPIDYLASLESFNLMPLWPSLRSMLPHHRPETKTSTILWRYKDIRPQLLRSGELVPVEKAERRVLVMANSGLGRDSLRAASTIYAGMQLILPGETAVNHRHTPLAIRLAVEGEGGFTIVDGEKCKMEPGDLILTPPGLWHEHRHEGNGPAVWLDILNLPLVHYMESSCSFEGTSQQNVNNEDSSETDFMYSGFSPHSFSKKFDASRKKYPMLRYPWSRMKGALEHLSRTVALGQPVRVDYVNPLTGGACLKGVNCSVVMLRPGEVLTLATSSASCFSHIIAGSGSSVINSEEIIWRRNDSFSIAPCSTVKHTNDTNEAAYIFSFDDKPLQQYLDIYSESFDNE